MSDGTRSTMLTHGAMVVMIALVAARAIVEHDPTPYWSHDPFRFAPPLTGFGTGVALAIQSLTILSAGIVLASAGVSVLRPWALIALLLGMIALAFRVIDPTHALGASNTLTLVSVLLASGAYSSVFPWSRKILIGFLIGLGLFMLFEGAHQYFVQHPQTVEYFEQTKEGFLSARGWDPGSFQARAYERRLRQPELLGWFQLSNVFAALMGALALMSSIVALRSSGVVRLATMIAALAMGAALIISGSKGAIGVTLLGAIVVGIALVKRPRIGTRSALLGAIVVLMLGLFVGAQLGQLSLVFRTQYLDGAVRVWLSDPLLGVGPGAFQDAYQSLKRSTAPEDVTSAHHIVFDWIAFYGIGGVALLVAIGSSIFSKDHEVEPEQHDRMISGTALRLGSIFVVFLGAWSVRMLAPVVTPDRLVALALGTLCWIAIVLIMSRSRLDDRATKIALFGCGSVALLHAMFDLGAATITSAPLLGVLLGGLVSMHQGRVVSGRIAGIATIVTALVVGFASIAPIQNDRALIEIAQRAKPFTQIHEQMQQGQLDPSLVASVVNAPVASDREGMLDQLLAAETSARFACVNDLIELDRERRDPRIAPIALRQGTLVLSQLDADDRESLGRRLRSLSDRLAESGSLSDLVLATRTEMALIEHGVEPPDDRAEDLVLSRWFEIVDRSPHDPALALDLMEHAQRLGMRDLAQTWAREALERSDRMALDPLRQLSEQEIRRAESVLDQGS